MANAVAKVLIYATIGDALLVLDQPDFPELALQVPGGSVEAGENPEAAAVREFEEETGLLVPSPPRYLATRDFCFVHDSKRFLHRRHFFHVILSGAPKAWTHFEMTPSGLGNPILFRLWWMSIGEASEKLGMGMGDALFAI